MRKLILTGALAATAFSHAASAAPSQSTLLPPYTAAYEPKSVDERGMWMEADEDERRLRDSPLVIRDEALNAYVRRVLCTTVGDDRCKGVRIYIVEVPAFNASMAPNGTMRVWSGLLLRVRNEAELGAVLGHEFAHFELRHTVSAFKRARTASDIMSWAAVLGGLAGVDTSLLQWSIVGSFYRFNRDQEQEADLLGLKYLRSSTYSAMAAPALWEHIMAEHDATLVGRKRKPRQHYSAGFFDTHPTPLNRATYLRDAASKTADDSVELASNGHSVALAKFMPQFLDDQIKLNDFGGTEYLLGQIASANGWTGDLLYARGELYRTRGNPRDLVSAAQFYGEAIKAGYTAPEARRGLGLSLMRSGQVTDGRAALNEYLRLKPEASDAKAISALVAN